MKSSHSGDLLCNLIKIKYVTIAPIVSSAGSVGAIYSRPIIPNQFVRVGEIIIASTVRKLSGDETFFVNYTDHDHLTKEEGKKERMHTGWKREMVFERQSACSLAGNRKWDLSSRILHRGQAIVVPLAHGARSISLFFSSWFETLIETTEFSSRSTHTRPQFDLCYFTSFLFNFSLPKYFGIFARPLIIVTVIKSNV